MQAVVQEVKAGQLHLRDGSSLRFGLCIWSTGVGPTPFIESLPFAKTSVGRVAVSKQLQVLLQEGQARRSHSSPLLPDMRRDAGSQTYRLSLPSSCKSWRNANRCMPSRVAG